MPEQNQRATQEKQQRRRRRADLDAMTGKRLAVDTSKLDPGYEYRWINDDPGRVHQLTKNDDWDIVEDASIKPDADGEGSAVSTIVGTNANGQGKRAFLARKPKEFYKEDHAAKMAQLDETDGAIRQGKFAQHDAEAQSMAGHAYVPEGGISMRTDRQG